MTNPLRGLRFSLLDFHSARANTGLKIAMLGIALIPLIYGALYLMAFYDPYGRLDTLPVVVVNEDEPAYTEGGRRVTAGDDLIAKLKDSDALDWHFVDDDAVAQRGLEDGTYYNKIIIPSDFSAKIASADTDHPEQARIVMVANEANNYLASILGASVMRVVTANANYAIGDNFYLQIFDSIEDTGDSLRVAADGALELESGLGDAHEGSATITSNLKSAADGARELAEGVASAENGSATITGNLSTLASGANSLAAGSVQAADGSATITDGLRSAARGADTLDRGLASLADGLASGTVRSSELAAGLHQLQTQGSAQLAAGAASLKAALDAKHADLATLDAGAAQVAGGVSQLATTLTGLSGQVAAMDTSISGMQDDLDDITSSSAALTSSLTAAGTKLRRDATTAAEHASAISGSLGSLPQGLADATDATGEASTLAASAQLAATNAASSAATAHASATSALERLDALVVGDEGYLIDATTYAALKSSVSASAQAADAASQYASAGAQAADGSGRYAAGAKAGLDTIGAGIAGMSDSLTTLTSDLTAVEGDLNAIASGASGLTAITDKSQALIDRSQTTITGASAMLGELSGHLVQLSTLNDGAAAVSAGVSSLVNTLTTAATDASGTPTLYGAASQLATGAAAVNERMGTAATGADQLTSQGWMVAARGSVTAHEGATALKAGLGQLETGSATLTNGLVSARSGAAQLASGAALLHDGSATLTDGLGVARDGSATLADGISRLHDGSATLTDGLTTATDGSAELAKGLADGVDAVVSATADADAKAKMMSEPVELGLDPYTSVANYGSGFAPYFIALGLWVGALVMTFLFKPLNGRLICSGANPVVAAFSGLAPWLIVGMVQSVLIGATIHLACGIDVNYLVAYYLLIILASWVFCAIIQMISAVFGFPGKFVAVVLLMLQLTTAAGTFPIETEFAFFQVLSPWLPMTYVVHALRMAMAGVNLALVGRDVAALMAFMAGAFAVTCLAAWRRRLVTMMDLHPLVDL